MNFPFFGFGCPAVGADVGVGGAGTSNGGFGTLRPALRVQ